MKNTATFRRGAAALGLVATAALSLLSNVLAPDWGDTGTERLAGIAAGGGTAVVSAVSFTLAQLPFLAAVLGIGHLLRAGAPRLSNLGTSLAVVGAFGHAVFGGIALVQLRMAADPAQREAYGALLDDVESSPVMAFAAAGLLGTVLGLVLLAVGLWRAGVGPRWVPATLGAFLVVEFVGSALSEQAALVSAALYVLALAALAVTVHRTPAAAWATDLGSLREPEPAAAAGQR